MTSFENFGPTEGLRQRRPTSSGYGGGSRQLVPLSDENAHPNHRDDRLSSGRAKADVPAPPRMSLASKSSFGAPQKKSSTSSSSSSSSPPPSSNELVPYLSQPAFAAGQEIESSLWIVAYGFRSEHQYRALLRRLESCGTVTARRGGLLADPDGNDDGRRSIHDNSWVALRFENIISARKALCQHGVILDVGGGGTIVVGVMPLDDPSAARRLGIDMGGFFNGAFSSQLVERRSSPQDMGGNDASAHGLMREEEILLHGSEGGRLEDGSADMYYDDSIESGLDSMCGKAMAWFFMWETPK